MPQTSQYTAWPEISAPRGLTCADFGLHGHGTRVVWAEGNPAASLAIILDNPGARERPDGVPFVCGTRQTLRRAIVDAGLDPGAVYVTYLLKCRPRKAYDRPAARGRALPWLEAQIVHLDPALCVLCGDAVTQTLLGTPVKAVRTSEISWQNRRCVASYHPLAARRRPALYPLLVEDLSRAAVLLGRN